MSYSTPVLPENVNQMIEILAVQLFKLLIVGRLVCSFCIVCTCSSEHFSSLCCPISNYFFQIADTLKGTRGVSVDKAWLCSSTREQPMRGNTILSDRRNFVNLRVSDARVVKQSTCHASVFGESCSFNELLDCLFMLKDISTMLLACPHSVCESPDSEKLFFSSLESVNTLSDCILRKLRGLLMIISLDCTKYELLEDENFNSLPKQNKEILGASNRKKKGKNRKVKKSNPLPKPTTGSLRLVKSTEVQL